MMTQINILSPFFLFSTLFILYIYGPYIYYIGHPHPFLIEEDSINKIFPLVVILLTHLIAFKLTKSKVNINQKFVYQLNKEKLFIISSFILALLAYEIFWAFNNSFGYFSEEDILMHIMHYRLSVERGVGFLIMIKKLLNIILFVLSTFSIYFLKYSYVKYKKLLVISLVLNIFLLSYFSFLSGSRYEFLYVLFLIFYTLYNQKNSKSGISLLSIFITIFIFLFIFSYYSLFRQSVDIESTQRDMFFEFIRRFDAVYPNFFLFLNSSFGNDYQYGASYFYFLVSFIPRFIIPEKPLNTQSIFNNHLQYNDAGLDFGVFSEMWWNFGPISFIFIICYLTVLYFFISKVYIKFHIRSIVHTPLYLFLVMNLTTIISSPINSTNMLFLIVYLFIIYYLSKLLKYLFLNK